MMALEDRFDELKTLGGGGFGRVLLVRDRQSGALVAAKMMKGRITLEARKRFAREIKQLQRYSGKNVIPLLEAFPDAKRPFFTMPIARSNLGEWAGRLSSAQVSVAMLRVMDALVAVHADGGFHRDIKPHNLLILDKGQTVVGDFGLGNSPRVTENFTKTAQGTLSYMAPELLAATPAPFTAACDIYSAGASWYHLITGTAPDVGHCPLDPRIIKRDADPWMATWINLMTLRDPGKRPTAAGVAAALRNRVRPASVPTPRPPVAGVPPELAGALALGAVFGILALIIASSR